MKQIRNQTKKEKNKTYEKLQLNDKIEKKQNFYKRNKDEIRNSKNED
jgi:transcription initiation factor IIE alpha subunit